MTLLYTDPIFQEHQTSHMHPERPERLLAILERLNEKGLIEKCQQEPMRKVDPQHIESIHSSSQIITVQSLAEKGGGYIDGDTQVSPRSYEVALTACGVAEAVVDAIMANRDTNALCLLRPPGHHATPVRSMGFCLFNTIALAAHHARAAHDLSRILIVDWDVHHGNGTQDIFYDKGEILFFSIHRYGHGFYPGTGSTAETGTGAGLGWTKNVALPYGINQSEYRDAFERGLQQSVEQCQPELILLSAGFDSHRLDPIGSLGLDTEDFTWMTTKVLEVAKDYCDGRLISFLEGGYHLGALSEGVQTHLEELLKASHSENRSE